MTGPHTVETKTKISKSLKGRTVSPETRARISAAHRGKVVSPETRAKMSFAKKEWWAKHVLTLVE
jgi:hypothetical protein